MNGKVEVERIGNIIKIGEETRDVSYFAKGDKMRWFADGKICEINSLRGFILGTKLYRGRGLTESQCSDLYDDIMKNKKSVLFASRKAKNTL